MKTRSNIKKFICSAMILAVSVSVAACSSDNGTSVPAEGYEMPSTFSDGSHAKLKTIDDTDFLVTSTDLIGNKTVHFTTEKTEEEVNQYFEKYFADLEEVTLRDKSDDTKGYYDKDRKLIVYNLVVWTADGKTNYKMSGEMCEKLSDSKYWEAR